MGGKDTAHPFLFLSAGFGQQVADTGIQIDFSLITGELVLAPRDTHVAGQRRDAGINIVDALVSSHGILQRNNENAIKGLDAKYL